jgi:hypothetical protein
MGKKAKRDNKAGERIKRVLEDRVDVKKNITYALWVSRSRCTKKEYDRIV